MGCLTLLKTVLSGLRGIQSKIVVTLGPGVDPAEIGPVCNHILLERFLPHGAILPYCRAMINHAGNGSVIAALSHAVPMVLLPQAADQFITAAACERSRVGVALPPHKLQPQTIAAAVTQLLSMPVFHSSAHILQAEILAMPTPHQLLASGVLLHGRCG